MKSSVARRIGVFVEREPERMLSLRADLVLLARYTKALHQSGTAAGRRADRNANRGRRGFPVTG
jgi:hypothetical protein